MDTQTARHLIGLAHLTAFARAHAFNDSETTSPAGFIADQFLRRCTDLADDFIYLVRADRNLNAAILQRSISERVFLLRYIQEHDRFMEFQRYSMAREYETLQHLTSQPQIGPDSKSTALQRKAAIRQAMQGEPDHPSAYWKLPKSSTAFTATATGHPNGPLVHITSYEFPSSAIHARHNDNEPTAILTASMDRNAATQTAVLISTALRFTDKQGAL